jgi:lambda family phage portal protein
MKLLNRLNPFRRSPIPIKTRGFEAARKTRLTTDWITGQTSINHTLRWELRTLIDRSRDLEENNEYISGFLRLVENNVLGSSPFALQMKVKEPDGRHDRIAEEIIEAGWKEWCKPANCSVTGRQSISDVYRLCLRSVMRDGAPLIRKHVGKSFGKFGFQLEVLEIDYLDVEYNDELKNGHRIVMSVEIDQYGRPLAYWLLGEHPGDTYLLKGRKRTRVPASDIIHPFIQHRAGQVRGYPVFAPIMMGLRQLSGYKEAEIVAARVASAKMGFFTKNAGEMAQYTGENAETGGKYMDAEPGSMEELPQGLNFQTFDPQHPTSQFGDFIRECLRGISSGLGQSYMTFANDAGDANYSSARIGMLEEREGYKGIQRWFIEHVCEPIFEDWLDMSLRVGALGDARVTLPWTKLDKFNRPFFQGRRWQWVDPKNDVEAVEKALKIGVISPARASGELGVDEEELLDEIKQTQSQRAAMGLIDKTTLEAIRMGRKIEEDEGDGRPTPLITSIGVGGVQALGLILPQISSGEMSQEAGIEILVTVFGFTTEQAGKITKQAKPVQAPASKE